MLSFKIKPNDEEERLDRFLQARTGLSRKKVKSLLDQGRIFIDGRKVIIASWEVSVGKTVEVRDETALSHPDAKEYFLKVVHEDPHLIVVEKEPGILCEPSPQATAPTLPEIINAYFKRKLPDLKTHYIGPVHRLDRDTSGLMVFTKTKEANKISDQFKRHSIERRYLVLVEGGVSKEQGKIEGYLQKSDLLKKGQKVKISTQASGQKAITHWRLIERYPNASLLEVVLNTGRTHQIRVHMAEMGHPVVGDTIYGKGGFRRQALHASFLGFHHPVTGRKMEFESKLPKDLRKLVDRLRLTA